MRILGIDPGLGGAYALLDGSDQVAEPFPLAGKGLDLAEIFTEWRSMELDIAVIERAHAMPKQGVASMFSFGRTCGQIEGVLAALGVRIEYATPQAWKKVVLAGTAKDKAAAIEYVSKAFPHIKLIPAGCKKPNDGLADAICLAEYGRRTFLAAKAAA